MELRMVFCVTTIGAMVACTPHAFSPPARMMPLQSAATLPRGQVALAAHGGVADGSFGPGVTGGGIRLRRGLTERLDGSVEGSLLWVDRQGKVSTHPGIYTLRAGTKLRVLPWLALWGGVGGGGSTAGGFIQPDVGLIVAFENRYLVPFIDGSLGVSAPFLAREVKIDAGEGGPFYGRPRMTSVVAAHVGLRAPIIEVASVLLALGITELADGRERQSFVQLQAGIEYYFK